MNVTKAIIMVAGWGTRMLPITKSIEKCMLPIGTRPVIDFVVRDIVSAGIKDIYFVVGEQSSQLQSYYRSNIPLNDYLRRKQRSDLLSLVAPMTDVKTHFIMQPSTGKYGTAVPAAMVNEFVDPSEHVLYMNGDQFFYREDGGSNAADLIRLVSDSNAEVGLFGNPVAPEDVSKFGIIEKDGEDNYVRIVEKPSVEDAPSNLNNSGFYLFNKEIFELSQSIPVDPKTGEYFIIDVINRYVDSGKKVIVGTVNGEYMECGSVDGWLRANNRIVGLTS